MLSPLWRQPQTRSSACDRAIGVDAAFVRLVFWRYRYRCVAIVLSGSHFGSSPLGISLRRERCPKKTRRILPRAVGGVVWASRHG